MIQNKCFSKELKQVGLCSGNTICSVWSRAWKCRVYHYVVRCCLLVHVTK